MIHYNFISTLLQETFEWDSQSRQTTHSWVKFARRKLLLMIVMAAKDSVCPDNICILYVRERRRRQSRSFITNLVMVLWAPPNLMPGPEAGDHTTVTSWWARWRLKSHQKRQSSASLAFVMEIHRSPVDSPHKGPVTRKMFPFDDVMMLAWGSLLIASKILKTQYFIFVYLIFMSQISLYFLHSTSLLSFHIDVVLTLSIGEQPFCTGRSSPQSDWTYWTPRVPALILSGSGKLHRVQNI